MKSGEISTLQGFPCPNNIQCGGKLEEKKKNGENIFRCNSCKMIIRNHDEWIEKKSKFEEVFRDKKLKEKFREKGDGI